MNKLLKHLKTIRTHRKYVRQMCFKTGLYWQGLVHDLSKYSIKELMMCKYWDGTKSPHQSCRDKIGYSPSWLNHYHKNKHHWEYWLDDDDVGTFIPIKMPYKYVIESFCDRVGASKAYNPKDWKPEILLKYWNEKCVGKNNMHPHTMDFMTELIHKLVLLGEDEFFKWYKENRKELKIRYNSMKTNKES